MTRKNLVARVACGLAACLLACPPTAAQRLGPGVGAGTRDPAAVLRAAAEAMRGVRSLRYEAAYEGQGALATRSASAEGEVFLSRLAADNPLKAKMTARGRFTPAGGGRPRPFLAAFDGRRILRLQPASRTATVKFLDENAPAERELAFVTSFFGGGPYELIMFEYLLDAPFSEQMSKAPVLEYEGTAAVGGVSCHVVYAEYNRGSADLRRERWYIGVDDNLPRKFEQVSVDDKGRYGAYVLTLSRLRANVPEAASVFTARVPAGYAVKPSAPPARPALLAAGEPAPGWELTDAAGAAHKLSDYRGKLVVMDFWATWCGPCLRAMPQMQALHEKYQNQGVVVLGINCWEKSNSAAWMRENGFDYGLLLHGEAVAPAYRVSLLPTVYVIGRDGRVLLSFTGLDTNLQSVLAQHAAEANH